LFALAQSTMSAGVPRHKILPVSRGWLSENILAARLGENFSLDITFHRTFFSNARWPTKGTPFSGFSSLPVIRQDLVVSRQVINDRQLNAAVAVGRVTPGPARLYIVSVGYFAAGVPGAIAGLLALITPSLSVILLLRYLRQKAEHPRVKSVLQSVVLASAGLLLAATIPLGESSLNSPWLLMVAMSSCLCPCGAAV
jgi:chromate transporter